jgi:hypothetical protein
MWGPHNGHTSLLRPPLTQSWSFRAIHSTPHPPLTTLIVQSRGEDVLSLQLSRSRNFWRIHRQCWKFVSCIISETMMKRSFVTADDENGCSLRCVQADVLTVHSVYSYVLQSIKVRCSNTPCWTVLEMFDFVMTERRCGCRLYMVTRIKLKGMKLSRVNILVSILSPGLSFKLMASWGSGIEVYTAMRDEVQDGVVYIHSCEEPDVDHALSHAKALLVGNMRQGRALSVLKGRNLNCRPQAPKYDCNLTTRDVCERKDTSKKGTIGNSEQCLPCQQRA